MRRRPPAAVLAVTLLVAGCGDGSDGDLDDLRAEVEARQQAESELEERVDALEEELAADGDVDVADAEDVDELVDRLDELASELAGLDDAVDAERRTREEVAAELEATAGDLRSTLSAVQGELEELRGQIEDLRVRFEILQERVDESQ